MARVSGVEIPDNKKAKISLTYVKGIGRALAKDVLEKAGIDPEARVKDLNETAIASINKTISAMEIPVEGELRRIVRANIKRLKDIGSYRGLRHKQGLPVRGQRTSRNARTRKGPRKTVGGIKRTLTKT
ncbi:30S ribosomal protein S13 [candidate division WWE3 bacterium]|nr:30S ribosomal protein S13 [candidate division WWE3 bacterium]